MKYLQKVLSVFLIFAFLLSSFASGIKIAHAASDTINAVTGSFSPGNPVTPGSMISGFVSASGTVATNADIYLEINNVSLGTNSYKGNVGSYTAGQSFNINTSRNFFAYNAYGVTYAYQFKIKICASGTAGNTVRTYRTSINYNITTSNPTTYKISGVVMDSSGIGVANANVYFSGTQSGNVTTDSYGNYSINSRPPGTYNVWPTKTNWVFTPQQRSVTLSSSNQLGVNFSGVETKYYTADGYVNDVLGLGVGGALVTYYKNGVAVGTRTTDPNGYYSISGLVEGGTFTFTPTKSGYSFNPMWQTMTMYADTRIPTFGMKPVNGAPVLTNGTVSPATGTTNDDFSFMIGYSDGDGDPATIHNVIIDGTSRTMVGDINNVFLYKTKLSAGTHSYSYEFSDGKNPTVTKSMSSFTVSYESPPPVGSVNVASTTVYADSFVQQSPKVYKANGNIKIGAFILVGGIGSYATIDLNNNSISGSGAVSLVGYGDLYTGEFQSNSDGTGLASVGANVGDLYVKNNIKIYSAKIDNIQFSTGTVFGQSLKMGFPGAPDLVLTDNAININTFTIIRDGSIKTTLTSGFKAQVGQYIVIDVPLLTGNSEISIDANNININAKMNISGAGPMAILGDILTGNVSVGLGLQTGDMVVAEGAFRISPKEINAFGVYVDRGYFILIDASLKLKVNWKTGFLGEARLKVGGVGDVIYWQNINMMIEWNFASQEIKLELTEVPWCILAVAETGSSGEPLPMLECLVEAIDINPSKINYGTGDITLDIEARVPPAKSLGVVIPSAPTMLLKTVSLGRVIVSGNLKTSAGELTMTHLHGGLTLGDYLGDYYLGSDVSTLNFNDKFISGSGTIQKIDIAYGLITGPKIIGDYKIDKNGWVYNNVRLELPIIPDTNIQQVKANSNGDIVIVNPVSITNGGIKMVFGANTLVYANSGLVGKGTVFFGNVRQGLDVGMKINGDMITITDQKVFNINGFVFFGDKDKLSIDSMGMHGEAEIRIPNLAAFKANITVKPDGNITFNQKTNLNIVGVPVANAQLAYVKASNKVVLDGEVQQNAGIKNGIIHLEIPISSLGINGATGYMRGEFGYRAIYSVNLPLFGLQKLQSDITLGTVDLKYANRNFMATAATAVTVPVLGTIPLNVTAYSNYNGVCFNSQTVLSNTCIPWSVLTSPMVVVPSVTASPGSTINNGAISVTLTPSVTGQIFYTLNGANPTVNSTRYTAPISITKSLTLKYFTVDTAGNASTIKTESYTIN